MAYRRTAFGIGEFYHCYSRGIDKRKVFLDEQDYVRFIDALFLCNSQKALHREHICAENRTELFAMERGKTPVSVVAYCLMPNHFHIILREKEEGGITRYMQKLGTAYTMYFNAKYERVGSLFTKPFRSKHIDDDRYLKQVIQYVHLNPVEILEPGWKEAALRSGSMLPRKVRAYPYSSLPEYSDIRRNERTILDMEVVDSLFDSMPLLEYVLDDAYEYHASLAQ